MKAYQYLFTFLLLIITFPIVSAAVCPDECGAWGGHSWGVYEACEPSNQPPSVLYDWWPHTTYRYEKQNYITNWSINPCIDQAPINQSSPILVSITAYNAYIVRDKLNSYFMKNCYNISYRAIMYYGTAYERDSGWTSSTYPLNPISFNFTANYSDASSHTATLKLFAKFLPDGNQQTILLNMTIASNVSTNNVYYGDCVSLASTGIESVEDNAINETFEDLLPGWPASTLYTIFMIIVLGLCWFGMSHIKADKTFLIGILSLVFVFMFILGVISGVLGWAYLGVIFVVISIYAGAKIRKVLT